MRKPKRSEVVVVCLLNAQSALCWRNLAFRNKGHFACCGSHDFSITCRLGLQNKYAFIKAADFCAEIQTFTLDHRGDHITQPEKTEASLIQYITLLHYNYSIIHILHYVTVHILYVLTSLKHTYSSPLLPAVHSDTPKGYLYFTLYCLCPLLLLRMSTKAISPLDELCTYLPSISLQSKLQYNGLS